MSKSEQTSLKAIGQDLSLQSLEAIGIGLTKLGWVDIAGHREGSMIPHLQDPKLAVLAVAAILVIAALARLYFRIREGGTSDVWEELRPHYERAFPVDGSEGKAPSKSRDRETRVEAPQIRGLDPLERKRFLKRWKSVQSGFGDSPKRTIAEADELLSSLMKTLGYPLSDFDQRAALVSSCQFRVVEDYRSAHRIATRLGKNQETLEDLRTAMSQYRSLLEELV
jgi:hypothetical protein